MAGAGAGVVFLCSGVGFIWGTGCESTFPINFHSGSDFSNGEPCFFARRRGFTHGDGDSQEYTALSGYYLNSNWECESSAN